jgi:hypothetical protein
MLSCFFGEWLVAGIGCGYGAKHRPQQDAKSGDECQDQDNAKGMIGRELRFVVVKWKRVDLAFEIGIVEWVREVVGRRGLYGGQSCLSLGA